MLNVKVKQMSEDNITVISLEGAMDSVSGNTITNIVGGEIAAGKKYFIIEMTKVNFINSMSILDLWHTKDRVRFCSGILKICGVNQKLFTTLSGIGLTGLLEFETTLEDAVNAIRKK
ncbi:MAG: hypothetical protein HY920_05750 [Elusimicrobia bacterium]|nr:hypothetical protein [Elusimicrobiota bacterium]